MYNVLVCIWLLCIYTAIVTLSFIHYTTFMCHVCCWLLLLCILFAVVFVVIENQAMLVASSIYHEKQCSFFSSIALCIQSCLRSLWKLHYCDCEFMSIKRTFSVHWIHSTILSSMILVTFHYIDAIDSTYSGLCCTYFLMHLFKASNWTSRTPLKFDKSNAKWYQTQCILIIDFLSCFFFWFCFHNI